MVLTDVLFERLITGIERALESQDMGRKFALKPFVGGTYSGKTAYVLLDKSNGRRVGEFSPSFQRVLNPLFLAWLLKDDRLVGMLEPSVWESCLFTIEQWAELQGVTQQHLYNSISQRKIPYVSLNARTTRIHAHAWDRWIESGRDVRLARRLIVDADFFPSYDFDGEI